VKLGLSGVGHNFPLIVPCYCAFLWEKSSGIDSPEKCLQNACKMPAKNVVLTRFNDKMLTALKMEFRVK